VSYITFIVLQKLKDLEVVNIINCIVRCSN